MQIMSPLSFALSSNEKLAYEKFNTKLKGQFIKWTIFGELPTGLEKSPGLLFLEHALGHNFGRLLCISPANMLVRACLTGRGSRCRPPKSWGPRRDSSAEEAEGSNWHNTDPVKVLLCRGIFSKWNKPVNHSFLSSSAKILKKVSNLLLCAKFKCKRAVI